MKNRLLLMKMLFFATLIGLVFVGCDNLENAEVETGIIGKWEIQTIIFNGTSYDLPLSASKNEEIEFLYITPIGMGVVSTTYPELIHGGIFVGEEINTDELSFEAKFDNMTKLTFTPLSTEGNTILHDGVPMFTYTISKDTLTLNGIETTNWGAIAKKANKFSWE